MEPIKWSLAMSIAGHKEHVLLYRAEVNGKGVQMEIATPKYKTGEFGKAEMAFFADGDPNKYETEEELVKAVMGE